MAINFPHSPTVNQTFTASGKTWKFDGASWKLTGASAYILPIATASDLGGIKVGSGLSIDATTGVLTATGGGGSAATDLGVTRTGNVLTVTSSSGQDVTIPLVNGGNQLAGLMSYEQANDLGVAVLETDTSTVNMQFVIDEDNFASNSSIKVPTQQSVKAYVDANSGGGGGGGATTLFQYGTPNTSLTDVVQTAGVMGTFQTGEVLRYNGVNWTNYLISQDIPTLLGDLTDVSNTAPSDGQVLKWSGANNLWMPATDLTSSGGTGIALTDLSVSTATASGGGALAYDNTNGTFTYTPADLSGVTATTNFIALTDTPGSFTADKWLKVNSGGTALEWADAPSSSGGANVSISETAPSTPSVGDLWWSSGQGQLKIWYDDGSGSPSAQWVDTGGVGGGGGVGSGGIALADLSVTTNAAGTAGLSYNNTNGVFSYTPPDLSGYLTGIGTLNQHTNVTITSPSNGEVLQYNGTAWVNGTVTTGSSNEFSFKTVAVSGQDDIVADTETDTLTFVAGSNISLTTDAATDSVTISSTTSSEGDFTAVGTIALWSGTIASIPAGWALCDGNNGTPNLLDRFVIGASDDDGDPLTAVTGVTGGPTQTGGTKDAVVVEHNHTASTANAGSHTHTGSTNTTGDHGHGANSNTTGNHTHTTTATGSASTSTNGDHTHQTGVVAAGSGLASGSNYTGAGVGYASNSGDHAHDFSVACTGTSDSQGNHSHTITVSNSGNHEHTLSLDSNNDHSHTVTVDNNGVSGTNQNLPPYYALAYIMKISTVASGQGESNEFSFKTVAVSGQDDIVAETTTDTLTLVAGNNVTLATDAATDSVTISSTDTNTDTFAGLTDTPNFLGSAGMFIKVNANGDGLEFTPEPSGGNGVVAGTIVMWSGSEANIPTGWQLCDGTNGTPDLQNKFVIGAGSSYAIDSTGGSKDAVNVSHNHGVGSLTTYTNGSHSHTLNKKLWAALSGAGGTWYVGDSAGLGGGTNVGTTNSGNHTHTIAGSVSTVGESGTDKNLPPYYALCYIMMISQAGGNPSDYRLKENIKPLTDATSRFNELKVCRFNFKNDPLNTLDGFLAHEVSDIVPEAVTGKKDQVDSKNNPAYQTLDHSKLVPLLTATLQEALDEIKDLKSRITLLEGN